MRDLYRPSNGERRTDCSERCTMCCPRLENRPLQAWRCSWSMAPRVVQSRENGDLRRRSYIPVLSAMNDISPDKYSRNRDAERSSSKYRGQTNKSRGCKKARLDPPAGFTQESRGQLMADHEITQIRHTCQQSWEIRGDDQIHLRGNPRKLVNGIKKGSINPRTDRVLDVVFGSVGPGPWCFFSFREHPQPDQCGEVLGACPF